MLITHLNYESRTMKQSLRYTILLEEVLWDRRHDRLLRKKGYGKFPKRNASCFAGREP